MLTRSTKKKKQKSKKERKKKKRPDGCGSSEFRSFVEVEVDLLGSRSLIFLMVSVDVKAILNGKTLSFGKVEVDVLGSPSLIVFMVSVDVKQH